MLSMFEQGTPIDVVTLLAELERRKTIEVLGGREGIIELSVAYYTSAHVMHHAQEIRRQSEARSIIKSITDLLQKPENITVADLQNITQAAEERQYIKDYTDRALKDIDTYKQSIRVKKHRIKTGFEILDAVTGGFRVPSVAMIGAYPSVGKTAFALNIASAQEKQVVFFSLEMSSEMIYERLASAKLKIDYKLFNVQRLSEQQYRIIEEFTETIKQRRFYVFDDAYYIEQQAEIIANVKPCLAIVDYVQKVRTHQKTDNRRIEIERISGLHKQLAKNNNCVILLLSQLTRPDKAVKNIKPTMASLKESGALEADGDYIGILHRPYVLHKDEPEKIRPEDGYILIDKNKFGSVGQIDLRFDGRYQQFYEIEKGSNKKVISPTPYSQQIPLDDDEELPFPV